MNSGDQPAAVHPSIIHTPALMRGLCEKIDRDLSELAWLLAGHPETLPPDSIEKLLKLNSAIHEIERTIRS